jgi:hypothetical protein
MIGISVSFSFPFSTFNLLHCTAMSKSYSVVPIVLSFFSWGPGITHKHVGLRVLCAVIHSEQHKIMVNLVV